MFQQLPAWCALARGSTIGPSSNRTRRAPSAERIVSEICRADYAITKPGSFKPFRTPSSDPPTLGSTRSSGSYQLHTVDILFFRHCSTGPADM
ncbi:hypothetical protein BWQ96_10352 [Gracilariopsis chorda]|uniref:Uncharacterized protein n=1 Tax=Gracilariopsis chorda TaxID=448386 RepID=A0A2V3ICX6_9FLOR|nr:hypothetical protein BWQ96_10352 [Gracilariopsis chorda]|eukprot:PXF39934.1 hypothetical protein BWQ96_10352 [Gracilariopsis chorda]